MLYCYPKFVRSSGLGNRLFSWARCKIYSHRHTVPMLSPHWAHVRRASITRGGIAYGNALRKILLWDNFKPAKGEICGSRRMALLLTAARISEDIDVDQFDRDGPDKLIVFSNGPYDFADWQQARKSIYDWLREITKSKWLRASNRYSEVPIGINVRRGRDFRDPTDASEFFRAGAIRTPLDWYVKALRQTRAAIGQQAKAFVVSEGTERDLRPLLQEPDVELVKSASAISDLLILAKSRILIGAGGSSFSAWASFLSGAPTVTHPGQSFQWFKLSISGIPFVGELDVETGPSFELVQHLDKALSPLTK